MIIITIKKMRFEDRIDPRLQAKNTVKTCSVVPDM